MEGYKQNFLMLSTEERRSEEGKETHQKPHDKNIGVEQEVKLGLVNCRARQHLTLRVMLKMCLPENYTLQDNHK